jgi:hypothetical protein
MSWLAFLMMFGFAMFLGLEEGHKQVQNWVGDAPVTPTPVATPFVSPIVIRETPTPVVVTSLNQSSPSKLEVVTDATGVLLQKTAEHGVEWTVQVFEQLLN